MSENLGVHAQLTMDGGNFVAETQKAYRALLDYRNEVARLKAEEESLRTATANLQRQITSKTEKLEAEKRKLEELNQSLSKNASLTDAQKTRLEKQTAKVDALEKSLAKANKQFDAARKKQEQNADAQSKITAQTAQATQEIERQTKAYAKNAKQGGDTASQLKSAFLMLKGLALGYAGKTLFSALIGSNAEFEQSLTSFEVLLGSAEKAQKMMDELTDFAAVTPLEMPDVTKATNMLLGYGVAAEDVIEVMGRLGDLAQGNAEKLDRVSLAYGQMLAKGKVTGEELRQMVEAQVPLLQGLADYMNVSTAELQKMIEKGEVGIDSLNGTITAMTSEGGKFFGMMEKQSKTMSGMFSTLKDDASIFAREVGQESFNYLKTELENLMATISQMEQDGSLNAVAKDIGGDIAALVKGFAELIKIVYQMKDVLITAGGAFIGLKAGLALSTVISSTVVAIKSLTTAIKGVKTATDAAKIANEAFKTSQLTTPWGAIAAAIGLVIGAIGAYTLAAGQANEKAVSMAKESADMGDEIAELAIKYRELASAVNLDDSQKQALTDTQGQLIKNLGIEAEAIDTLIAKYGSLDSALSQLTLQKLREAENSLITGLGAAEETLLKEVNETFGAVISATGKEAVAAFEALEKSGLIQKELFGEKGGQIILAQSKNVEEAIGNYKRLGEMLDVLKENFSADELKDNSLFTALSARYQDLSTVVGEYSNAVDSLNRNLAEQQTIVALQGRELPKTQEEFRSFSDSVVQAAQDSGNFIGSAEEVRKAVVGFLQTMPQFKEYFGEISNDTASASQGFTNATQSLTDLTTKLSATVDGLEILDAAYKKVSQGQSLTAEEVLNLTAKYPDLETAVIKTADGFIIEKDALEKVAGSSDNLKINHIQAQIEMTRNLLTQSSERLSALNVELDGIKSLADAYAQLAGGNGQYLGMTYREYASRWVANGAQGERMTKAEFEQMTQDARNVVNYGKALDSLASAQERLKNITIPTGGSSKSSGSKSSGSKKDPQKEYEENVKKYKAAVEDIIKTDEEWNEHEKKMGRLSDGDFYGNMARRADALREEADKVLKVEWMAWNDRLEIRDDFIRQAELTELEYKEGYVGMADEVVKAEKDALDEMLKNSERYIEYKNMRDDWGEDNEIAALERILDYHEKNYQERRDILKSYYEDGTYTLEEYNERIIALEDEAAEKRIEIGDRIYKKAKEQGEEYYKEVSERLKSQYEMDLDLQKQYWEAVAEYRSNAMLQEVERLENQLKKQTAKIDAQLEELADALEAFDRRMEDEHDDRKLKRLQYNLEYESDEDNRRSLEKEIEKLEEEIAEKKFRRDIADQQEALNEKKDRVNEEMQYEIDAAKKAGDEMVESAKTRIDRINEYYKNKMSAANIANEFISGLTANGEKFEYAGEVMGELMATGISKTLDGYLNGIYSSIGNLGVKMNRGAASHEMVHRVVNNNQSYTTNITTTKPVSPAEARKYAKKWQKINELESGV